MSSSLMFALFSLAFATTGKLSRSAVSVLRTGETVLRQHGDGLTPAA